MCQKSKNYEKTAFFSYKINYQPQFIHTLIKNYPVSTIPQSGSSSGGGQLFARLKIHDLTI